MPGSSTYNLPILCPLVMTEAGGGDCGKGDQRTHLKMQEVTLLHQLAGCFWLAQGEVGRGRALSLDRGIPSCLPEEGRQLF